MGHKRFELRYPEGGVEVHFNLDYDGNQVIVDTIQVNSSFKIDIPNSPGLEMHNGKWMLYSTYLRKEGGNNIEVHEYNDSKIANDIVNAIIKIKDQETPNFTK